MAEMKVPIDNEITLEQLDRDPYPIYKRLRREAPVLHISAARRTVLTKASDTRYVKSTPELFSANDPNTPMQRALGAHTLMRKDGDDHRRERMAMNAAFSPKVIANDWIPQYKRFAEEYVERLPKGEVVDLFDKLSGPYAARGLAILLGMEEASDEEMQEWSQSIIEGAGNFGWLDKLFERSDRANKEVHALLDSLKERHVAEPNNSAFSVMLNAENPIPIKQMYSNIKIAIGGGINEPRDALNTILYGLLTNPSANRDEELFEDGESFNVYRDENPHQAFGIGPHLCQGNRVARSAIGEIMLPILFDRFPNMKIPDLDQVIWKGFGFRGPIQMPVLMQ